MGAVDGEGEAERDSGEHERLKPRRAAAGQKRGPLEARQPPRQTSRTTGHLGRRIGEALAGLHVYTELVYPAIESPQLPERTDNQRPTSPFTAELRSRLA